MNVRGQQAWQINRAECHQHSLEHTASGALRAAGRRKMKGAQQWALRHTTSQSSTRGHELTQTTCVGSLFTVMVFLADVTLTLDTAMLILHPHRHSGNDISTNIQQGFLDSFFPSAAATFLLTVAMRWCCDDIFPFWQLFLLVNRNFYFHSPCSECISTWPTQIRDPDTNHILKKRVIQTVSVLCCWIDVPPPRQTETVLTDEFISENDCQTPVGCFSIWLWLVKTGTYQTRRCSVCVCVFVVVFFSYADKNVLRLQKPSEIKLNDAVSWTFLADLHRSPKRFISPSGTVCTESCS